MSFYNEKTKQLENTPFEEKSSLFDTVVASFEEFGIGAIGKTLQAEAELVDQGIMKSPIDPKTGLNRVITDEESQQSNTFPEDFDYNEMLRIIEWNDYTDEEKLSLYSSKNEVELYKRMNLIEQTNANMDTISHAGGVAMLSSMVVAGVVNPLNAIPVAWAKRAKDAVKLAKLAGPNLKIGAATGAAIGAVEEAYIHYNDPGASITTSLINVGFIAGIGAGAGHLIDRKVMKEMGFARKVRKSLYVPDHLKTPGPRPSLDAHPVSAYGAEKLANLTSPLVRLLTSPSEHIRNFAANLLETPFAITDNLAEAGFKASPDALESVIKRKGWMAHNDYLRKLEAGYNRYLTGKGGGIVRRKTNSLANTLRGNPDGKMNFEEFDSMITKYRVGTIGRVGDQAGGVRVIDDIPTEIKELAGELDKIYKEYEPQARLIWEVPDEAELVKRLDEQSDLNMNYLTRRYNTAEIAQDPERFIHFLERQWMKNENPNPNPADLKEFRERNRRVVNKMIQSPTDRIVLEDVFQEELRAGLKSRKWTFIDDADLYDTNWVLTSSKDNISYYSRNTITDIQFHNHFGTLDMDGIIGRLKKDAIDGFEMPNPEQLAILQKEIDLAESMLQRVRGTYMSPNSPLPGSVAQRTINGLMKFSNLTIGGGFMLSSFPDVGRPIMHMGFVRAYGPAFEVLFKRNREVWSAMKAAGKELDAWNVANELEYAKRLASMTDQIPLATNASKFERMLSKASDDFFLLNGLTLWNQYMKKNVGIGVVDKIISAAEDLTRTGKLPAKLQANLAQMGLDENALKVIAKEFGEHGTSYKGVRLTDYQNWSKGSEAVLERMKNAVAKEIDTIIVTPGLGDVPLIMTNDYAKMVMQYKTFALASTNRMMVRGLQQPDANLATGLLISMVAGAAVQDYKDWVGGREFNLNDTISSGIDRSGILASVGVANEMIQQTPFGNFGFTGTRENFDWDVYGAGPSASTVKGVMDVMNHLARGNMGPEAMRATWNVTPYNNMIPVEAAISLGLGPNAYTDSANEYYRSGKYQNRVEENTFGFDQFYKD